MAIENLLEYQSKDFEIFKLEKQLYDGEDKKVINDMIRKVKDSQNRSLQLEKNATDLVNEFENLKKSFDENIKKLNMMTNSNVERLSETDFSSYETSINALVNNLSLIENKLSYFAKKINVILTDFEQAKKTYNNARQEYLKHKTLYDEKEGQLKPQIDEKSKELAKLEKNIDVKLLARYKSKRQDKKFPILVPLNGNDCGGCQMQLSYASISSLKENEVIECEHCRRLIYFK